MTHDPLCHGCVASDGLCDSNCAACQCDLISKVRADQMARCIGVINSLPEDYPRHMTSVWLHEMEFDEYEIGWVEHKETILSALQGMP